MPQIVSAFLQTAVAARDFKRIAEPVSLPSWRVRRAAWPSAHRVSYAQPSEDGKAQMNA